MDNNPAISSVSNDLCFPTYDSFYSSSKSQTFSFPKTIMEYIWLHPKSLKGYQKLIKTCKLLFLKNPIIITSSLANRKNKKWKIGEIDAQFFELNYFMGRFWLIGTLNISFEINVNLLISKIFQCEVIDLNIYDQSITFDQFKFLGFHAQRCMLVRAIIKHDNGTDVSFAERFAAMPKIEKLYSYCFNSIVSPDTVKKLVKIEHFKNIKELLIEDVPDGFDVEELNEFLKEHKIYAKIILRFQDNQILSVNYVNHLQKFVNKIIETKVLDFVPTRLYFEGMQSRAKFDKICTDIFNQHYGIPRNPRFAN